MRTCPIEDFAVPANHRLKIKENEKQDKYLDLARELKTLWNIKVMVISIVSGTLGTVTKWIDKGTGGLGYKRTSGDHLNNSIIKINQNTEKSPGDLRGVTFTQTLVKDHHLTLLRKTQKEYNNNNKNRTNI